MHELLNFPPSLGIFDVHTFWHACAIPIGFVWYDFIAEDRECILSSRKTEYAPLGRFALCDMCKTVAVGVVQSVNKNEYKKK